MWSGNSDEDLSRLALRDFVSTIRRHWAAWLVWMVVCTGIAACSALAALPVYIGTVQVVLEPTVLAEDGPEVIREFHQFDLDNEQAQTQTSLVLSDDVLRPVFDALDLVHASELSPGTDSTGTRMLRWWHSVIGEPVPDPELQAFSRFKSRVRARRVLLSYVLEIGYRAQDGWQAARVSNAIVSSYLQQRIEDTLAAATVEAPYLKIRSDSLRAQIAVAAHAMRSGTLPVQDLPDAAVRTLGPAVQPLGKVFPKFGPLVFYGASFGFVTGLLVLAAMTNRDPFVRSSRRLELLLGLRCVAAIPAISLPALVREGWKRNRGVVPGHLRSSLEAARAAFAAHDCEPGRTTVGFVAWEPTATPAALAAGLEASLGASMSARDPSVRVKGVPALGDRVCDREAIDRLDAAILVVDAHRSTFRSVRAALRTLKTADIPLVGVILDHRRSAGPSGA